MSAQLDAKERKRTWQPHKSRKSNMLHCQVILVTNPSGLTLMCLRINVPFWTGSFTVSLESFHPKF